MNPFCFHYAWPKPTPNSKKKKKTTMDSLTWKLFVPGFPEIVIIQERRKLI